MAARTDCIPLAETKNQLYWLFHTCEHAEIIKCWRLMPYVLRTGHIHIQIRQNISKVGEVVTFILSQLGTNAQASP